MLEQIAALRSRDFEKVIGKTETYFKATVERSGHSIDIYVKNLREKLLSLV